MLLHRLRITIPRALFYSQTEHQPSCSSHDQASLKASLNILGAANLHKVASSTKLGAAVPNWLNNLGAVVGYGALHLPGSQREQAQLLNSD